MPSAARRDRALSGNVRAAGARAGNPDTPDNMIGATAACKGDPCDSRTCNSRPRAGASCRALALATFAAMAGTANAAEPTATIVEFHNAALDHYFITASPAEAAALDAGSANPGWTRTGVEWKAWASAAEMRGAVPVCRFVAARRERPRSHFYTGERRRMPDAQAEPGWKFEGDRLLDRAARRHTGGALVPGRHDARLPQLRAGQHAGRGQLPLRHGSHAAREDGGHLDPRRRGHVLAAFVGADRRRHRAPAGTGDVGPERGAARAGARSRASPPSSTSSWRSRRRATPRSRRFRPTVRRPASTIAGCRSTPRSFCARDNYTLFQLQREFFRNAVQAPDQLRQRVAFALSQILVTSGTDINKAYAMQRYQQLLADHAFGNFRARADRGDTVAGDGQLPRHGQQRASPMPPPASSPTRTTRASCCSSSRSARSSSNAGRHAAASTRTASRSPPTTRTRSRATRTSSPAGPIRRRRARRAGR